MTYFTCLTLLFILALINGITTKKKIINFLSFVIFSYFLTDNYFNGIDFIYYSDFYSTIEKNSHPWDTFEPGYTLINIISSILKLSYEQLHLANTLIIIYLLSVFLKRQANTPFFIFLIFCFLGWRFAEQTRQAIAVIITAISLQFSESGEKGKSFTLMALASAFHISALAAIPFLLTEKINKKSINILCIASITLVYFIINHNILSSVMKIINYRAALKLTSYINSDYHIGFGAAVPLFTALTLKTQRENKYHRYAKIYISAFLIFCIIVPSLYRQIYYFYIPLFLYWSESIANARIKINKIVIISFIFIFSLIASIRITLDPLSSWAKNWNSLYIDRIIYGKENTAQEKIVEKCNFLYSIGNDFCDSYYAH